MTFTITVLRTDIADDLRDAGATDWTTAQLDRAIDYALDRYTRVRPRQQVANLTGIASRQITLSAAAPAGLGTLPFAALIAVTAAEYPIGRWPPEFVRFDTYAGTLQLHLDTQPVAAAVNLHYDRLHTLDATSGTLEDRDRDVLAIGAVAYALRQRAIDAAAALNVAPDYDTRLRRLAEEALAHFDAMLERIRSEQPLRQRRAYAPREPLANRDIVRWPGA